MKEHGTCIGDVMPLEVMARRNDWSRGVLLYVRKRIVGVSDEFAEPLVFKPATESDQVQPPALHLSIQSAQQLMDELWQCGLRPTEGTGSAGSLAATERHLADMRRLVFEDVKQIIDKIGPGFAQHGARE